MFDIAYHGDGTPVSGKDIAAREEVPHRFLEQILLALKRADLVASRRGPSGGYLLAREPGAITIAEVVNAIDGPLEVSFCQPTDEQARLRCQISSKCVTAAVWRDLAAVIRQHLESVTIDDMVRQGETLGVPKEGQDAVFYVI